MLHLNNCIDEMNSIKRGTSALYCFNEYCFVEVVPKYCRSSR